MVALGFRFRVLRLLTIPLVFAVVAALLNSLSSMTSAQSSPEGVPSGVTRVEEDWKVIIENPSPETDSPQLTVVFGPADPESGTHAIFELNHSTQPDFMEGGMQLQCWWGESLIGYKNQHHPAEFYVPNETVTFTTGTEIRESRIRMDIANGHSQSFGDFGGETYLKISVLTSRPNLDGFDADFSLNHSRCGWGSNHVRKFCRTAIRYYNDAGEVVSEDTTERVIHAMAD
jgi:hypothetical protein